MNALHLRILACLCMLLDHIGYVWNVEALRVVGRLAFPLFVFLICNGFVHTSDRRRYALRLGVFALISQIPFDLMLGHTNLFQKGNVFVTLLLTLLCLWTTEELRRREKGKYICWLPAALLFGACYLGHISSDYGAKGVLLAMVFYLVERKTLRGKVLTVLGMFLAVNCIPLIGLAVTGVKWVLQMDAVLPKMTRWIYWQNWSLLSALPIFLYNGKKGPMGPSPKLVQYGFYLFYPAHQLILWALKKWIG